MKHRSLRALGAVTAVVLLASCTTESDESTPTDGPPATEPVAATEPTTTAATDDAPSTEPPATEPPVTEPVATASGDDETPATEPPATEPAPTEPPAPAEPQLGGRSFSTEVQAESQFEGNPFPNLVVDDVGRGGQANIANILPSDRPVLLWTFAPH